MRNLNTRRLGPSTRGQNTNWEQTARFVRQRDRVFGQDAVQGPAFVHRVLRMQFVARVSLRIRRRSEQQGVDSRIRQDELGRAATPNGPVADQRLAEDLDACQ